MDEMTKKMWYTFMTEFYSSIKKNQIILLLGKIDTMGDHHIK